MEVYWRLLHYIVEEKMMYGVRIKNDVQMCK